MNESSGNAEALTRSGRNWRAVNERLVDLGHGVASLALLVLLIHIAASVVGRLAFGHSLPATIELVSNWWMVVIFYFGLAATHRRNEHIRITAIVDMVGTDGRRLVRVFVALYGILAFGTLTWFSGQAAYESVMISEQTFGVFAIPVWPIKLLLPVALTLLVVQNLIDLVDAIQDRPVQPNEHNLSGSSLGAILLTLSFLVAMGGLAMVAFVDLGNLTTGLVSLAAMLATMFLGVPVGLAMIVCGAVGLVALAGPLAAESTLTRAPFHAAASWSLSVLPMFILMGLVMWRTGLTEKVFEVFQRVIGIVPGGLAVATNFSGAALASASGSSAAISYSLGRIAIPEMLKRGYEPSLATGVVVMAGVIGNLIPPSIVLIVYSGVAQTPVGPQLMAAVVPGVLIALAYTVLIVLRSHLNPRLAPRYVDEGVGLGDRLVLLRHLWSIPLIVAMVLGTMYGGLATATEAGALGCLTAVIIGFIEIRRRGGAFWPSLRLAVGEAVTAFAGIMLLFVGVDALNRLIALSGLAYAVSEWVSGLGLGPRELLLLLMLVYLVLGTFMDTMAIILLTVPIFSSMLVAAGVDMVWFGVFITVMAELAVVTPPLGILVFIVHRLAQDRAVNMGRPVSLSAVFRGCAWFVIATLLCVLLFIQLPELVLTLPGRL